MEETITWQQWDQARKDFDGKCAYCRERPGDEREHFIPRARGGKLQVGNCLPVCRSCNVRKSDATGTELIGLFGRETIERLQQYLASKGSSLSIDNQQIPPSEWRIYPGRANLRIKELAQDRGLRQYELAEKSGVTPQLLNRYWNNSMQRVSLEHLALIAKVLGVDVGDLFIPDGESGGPTQSEKKAA